MTDGSVTGGRQMPMKRGIYLVADTPLSLTPLALEGGGGDKNLLVEAIAEQLTDDELDEFIDNLIGEYDA